MSAHSTTPAIASLHSPPDCVFFFGFGAEFDLPFFVDVLFAAFAFFASLTRQLSKSFSVRISASSSGAMGKSARPHLRCADESDNTYKEDANDVCYSVPWSLSKRK